MRIIQLTCHFAPNIGGVETHLRDLVSALQKRGHKVFVLTYKPLTASADWRIYEEWKSTKIFRIPWFSGIFYSLVKMPVLEFLYLFPALFFILPFVILSFHPDVINAHGLVAGAVGVFWGKVFGKRVIISLHSIYHFPKNGVYRKFVEIIFSNSYKVLGLSNQSKSEIEGVIKDDGRVGIFTYWIDLKKFKRINQAKEKIGWGQKFIVLYVGRLVEEKGILLLLESVNKWKKEINLAVIGTGPLEDKIKSAVKMNDNLIFVGRVRNEELPIYYSAADVLIVPSIHEEGFGRVILESLACGTPVIGSGRGAIPEAMDETVGKFISVSPKNITRAAEYFYKNQSELKFLAKKARKYAESHFSEKNVDAIISSY